MDMLYLQYIVDMIVEILKDSCKEEAYASIEVHII